MQRTGSPLRIIQIPRFAFMADFRFGSKLTVGTSAQNRPLLGLQQKKNGKKML